MRHVAHATQPELADALSGIVGRRHVLAEDDLRAPFETDWTGRFGGRARLVVRPADTDEVAGVLAACHARRVPVVPQGGNASRSPAHKKKKKKTAIFVFVFLYFCAGSA